MFDGAYDSRFSSFEGEPIDFILRRVEIWKEADRRQMRMYLKHAFGKLLVDFCTVPAEYLPRVNAVPAWRQCHKPITRKRVLSSILDLHSNHVYDQPYNTHYNSRIANAQRSRIHLRLHFSSQTCVAGSTTCAGTLCYDGLVAKYMYKVGRCARSEELIEHRTFNRG